MSNSSEIWDETLDAVVIGGGAAGLSGALMLARSRRSVVVIDNGKPRNSPAAAVHGLLARDGTPPSELLRTGREEVRRYGGQVETGEVVATKRDAELFAVILADGRTLRARRLLVTTGLVDVLPDVDGLAERWGRDVVHCPYCHGYEVRDRAIGILATGPSSVHHALMFRQLSDDVVYFTNGTALDDEPRTQFAARDITVIDGVVGSVQITGDKITGVRLDDGRLEPREVIAIATYMEARAGFLADLGLPLRDHPNGVGHYIPADQTGRTDVRGVWVAGNVTDVMAQVGSAAAAGASAGAQINADLVMDDTREAVARLQAQPSPIRSQPEEPH